MTVPVELSRLASAQDGLVTRHQALSTGMSREAIRYALGAGMRWQRIVRGVYATFTGPLQERHYIRAAILYAGEGAMVSGPTACRAYGMRYAPKTQARVILVPVAVHRKPIPIAVFRRTRRLPIPRSVYGIPCAPPARAVLDSCDGLHELRTVRATLCEVVQRGLTDPAELAHEFGQKRFDGGGATARRAIADVTVGCRSAPECELRDLTRTSTIIPEPRWNEVLPGAGGADLRPDGCLAGAQLVLEVDSVEYHRYGDQPELTERRRARYAALGWRVLPISPRRLREEPAAVLREIEAAYLVGLDSAARRGGSAEWVA